MSKENIIFYSLIAVTLLMPTIIRILKKASGYKDTTEKVKEIKQDEPEIPSEFQNLSKKPMSKSYSNGNSYCLKKTKMETLSLKKRAGTTILAFSGIFLSILIVITVYDYISKSFHDSLEMGVGISIFFVLVIFAFGGGGILMLWIASLKNEFDLNINRYMKKEVDLEQWLKITEYNVPFSDIKAIQILKKESHSSESDIICHELNIVLKDLKRINVIPHGTADAIKEDAELITEYLNIPLIHQNSNL